MSHTAALRVSVRLKNPEFSTLLCPNMFGIERAHTRYMGKPRLAKPAAFIAVLLLTGATSYGQLSSRAYRVLGQPDLRQNGVNGVQGNELRLPRATALDRRDGTLRLYVVGQRQPPPAWLA